MQTPKHRWDVERAAAWLRRHGWGDAGEEGAPAFDRQLAADAAQAAARQVEQADPEAPFWPPRAAPGYD